MPQIDFGLFDVRVSDVEDIGRYIDLPANQNSLLYQTIFPQFNAIIEA